MESNTSTLNELLDQSTAEEKVAFYVICKLPESTRQYLARQLEPLASLYRDRDYVRRDLGCPYLVQEVEDWLSLVHGL